MAWITFDYFLCTLVMVAIVALVWLVRALILLIAQRLCRYVVCVLSYAGGICLPAQRRPDRMAYNVVVTNTLWQKLACTCQALRAKVNLQ